MRPSLLAFAVATLASAAWVAGCRDPKLGSSGCRTDADCGNPATAYRCEERTGVCYCRTDQACPLTQLCNANGFCQDRAGCQTNADCVDPSLFCDTTQGNCLPKGRCSLDVQCPLGQVCDTRRSACVDGCRRNGDCNGSSCRCGDGGCVCTGTTPAEIARCQIGVCDPNFCADDTVCPFGQKCGVIPDSGVELASCHDDYDTDVRPYCDVCSFGGGTQICGSGPNYCLIDTRHPGSFYCGSDCSQGQTCPRGYACQDVIVVLTQWSCSRANPGCPVNTNLPCTKDAECRRGGVCVIQPGLTSGYCAGRCAIDEGDNTGFCGCQVDTDCAPETCTTGECSISRRKCVNDTDCRSIRCVDFSGSGGCLIGQNCAPSDGLTCNEVK
jgi:hypothetical protein